MPKEQKSGLGRGLGALLGDMAQAPQNIEETTFPSVEQESSENIFIEADNVKIGNIKKREVIKNVETEPSQPIHKSIQTEMNEEVLVEKIINPEEIDIELIVPNPNQPRTVFKKEELEELSESIKTNGLLQPILVRKTDNNKYQIIAGERRWQATKLAGIKTIAVRVKETKDNEALELALIENIQRTDLNPIEEAYAYKRILEAKKITQVELAKLVSKGRSTITNALRLLELPETAQQLLHEGKITAGHARAILSVTSLANKETLTKKIIEDKLNVREVESLARLLEGKENSIGVSKKPTTPRYFKTVAKELRKILQTNVKVKTVQGKNKIEIEFATEEELKELKKKLTAFKTKE